MQMEFIDPALQRDVVGEIPLPAGAVNVGILGAPDVLDIAVNRYSAGEKSVSSLGFAGVVHIGASGAGQDTNFISNRESHCRGCLGLSRRSGIRSRLGLLLPRDPD